MATAGIEKGTGRHAVGGLVAGTAASAVMVTYAMVAAATYQDTGFFTPLYHIASTFIAPSAMEASMQQAMGGDSFYFDLGPRRWAWPSTSAWALCSERRSGS